MYAVLIKNVDNYFRGGGGGKGGSLLYFEPRVVDISRM